jgi:hypothetical protein
VYDLRVEAGSLVKKIRYDRTISGDHQRTANDLTDTVRSM